MAGFYLEDLSVGQSASQSRKVTDADVAAFAQVSGDHNPLHMDEAYARTTPFGGRIAHGMLTGAYISATMGGQLPGPGAVYISQSLRFKRPVRIGDEVFTKVVITAIDAKAGHVKLQTTAAVNGKAVVTGEAVVSVPRRGA